MHDGLPITGLEDVENWSKFGTLDFKESLKLGKRSPSQESNRQTVFLSMNSAPGCYK